MVINSIRPSGSCLSCFFFFIMYFDSKDCESHLSLSLNCFDKTNPSTNAINNQINSGLSMLQLIVYTVYSTSTDLNRKYVQRLVNGI